MPALAWATAASGYAFFDLTAAFLRLVGSNLRGGAAVQAYRNRLVKPHRLAFELIDPIDDPSIAAYVDTVAKDAAPLTRLGKTFRESFHRLWARFDASLPLEGDGTRVYLLPAPEDALGGCVRFDGRYHYVVLGSEVMGFLENGSVAGDVFIHHELAHLHHQQQNPEIRDAAHAYFAGKPDVKLYQMLWLEGLAVYISERLNPTASEWELLHARDIQQKVAGDWPRLKVQLREAFDSGSHAEIARHVFNGDEARQLPAKTGYYVGYRLAQVLGAQLPLRQLPRLGGEALRNRLLAALEKLELAHPAS